MEMSHMTISHCQRGEDHCSVKAERGKCRVENSLLFCPERSEGTLWMAMFFGSATPWEYSAEPSRCCS